MNPEQIYTLNKLYNPPLSLLDKVLPFIIIFMVGCFTIAYLIKIDLSTSNLDWEKNKCIPKYMFVSGFIKKENGLGILASTKKNFKNCINDYLNTNTVNKYATNKENYYSKKTLRMGV